MPSGSGTNTMINVGEGTGGGMMTNPSPGAPSHWLPYISVVDIAASTAQAKSLGATVIQDVVEVGNNGWMSIIVYPTGATFGLWKKKLRSHDLAWQSSVACFLLKDISHLTETSNETLDSHSHCSIAHLVLLTTSAIDFTTP